VYDFGFKTTRITVRLQGEDLLAEVFDDYRPSDPRPDRTTNYVLRRQWVLRPDVIIRPDSTLSVIILLTPTP
jgi:hypothetical protein